MNPFYIITIGVVVTAVCLAILHIKAIGLGVK